MPERDLLAGLNDEQRTAAEQLLGPVRILAGAGTGKTRAITHRIAHGIASEVYQPQWVMALTFTAKSAAEMRYRLRSLGVPPVAARTFHAAALAQLRYFWPRVVGGYAPHLLDSKPALLREVAERLQLGDVSRDELGVWAREIEWRKVRDLTVEEYQSVGRAVGPDPGMMARIMLTYEQLKDAQRAMDFEDVLLANLGMLRNEPGVLQEVQGQYRVFVVDEFQDVSPVQYELLRLWLGRRRDLCVVGDVSQTIYRFAGADHRYLLDFEREFPGATSVTLTRNYRSTRQIVEAANRLVRTQPGAVLLESEVEGPEPTVTGLPSDAAQARWVAERCAELVAAGASPSGIAVLVRTNDQGVLFERALADAGVPCATRGAQPFFSRPEVVQAMVLLRQRVREPGVADAPTFQHVTDAVRALGWTSAPPAPGTAEHARWESLHAFLQLVDAAGPDVTLEAFVADLEQRRAHQFEPRRDAVDVLTIHQAKGLEWDHVFVCGVSEGVIPIAQATATQDGVDEELRLLYVAMTRARRRLWLTWSRSDGVSARRREPSRFLAFIRARQLPAESA